MMKITEIFDKQDTTVSFEFFPPKDYLAAVDLGVHVGTLTKLNPSFVSVTYGAGGSNQEKSFGIIDLLHKKLELTVMAHYTCVNATMSKVQGDLDFLHKIGIENLMLLRGDPPKGETNFVPSSEDFRYASDLVTYAKKQNRFAIGAAAYPELHLESDNMEQELMHLKLKVDSGADFLMTQMFFANSLYFDFVEQAKQVGINCRIIPGIIPITNYKQIKRFAAMSNATIPTEIELALEPYQDNPEKMYQIGVDFAIKQCAELIEGSAPGLHFYTLNKSRATLDIYESLKNTHAI